MVKEVSPVLGSPSWRHWRATEEDESHSRESGSQTEESRSLHSNPRERILANFRVLARTNVILRTEPARAATGD